MPCQMFRLTHNKTYFEKLDLLMEPEASAAALANQTILIIQLDKPTSSAHHNFFL